MTPTGYSPVVELAPDKWASDEQSVDPADGVVQLASADPRRRSATIYTDPTSVGALRLVPGSGQSRGGIRLVPGAGFTFAHGAAIYGYAQSGPVLVNVVTESGAVC